MPKKQIKKETYHNLFFECGVQASSITCILVLRWNQEPMSGGEAIQNWYVPTKEQALESLACLLKEAPKFYKLKSFILCNEQFSNEALIWLKHVDLNKQNINGL